MERIQGTVHDIQIVERGSLKYMRFGSQGGWQGVLDKAHPLRPVFPYQRAFAALVPKLIKETGNFLSIGVGTGTSLRSVQAACPGVELYGVELDEKVLETAMYHFEAPSYKTANYFVGDGLEFLERTSEKFSLIFIDAYMSNRIDSACLQPSVPELVRRALLPGGFACFNIITTLPPKGTVKHWTDSAKEQFESVWALPVGIPYTEQNVLIVLSAGVEPLESLRNQLRSSSLLTLWEKLSWPVRLAPL